MDAALKKILFLPKWYPNKIDPYEGNFIEFHAQAVKNNAEIAVLYVHADPQLERDYECIAGMEKGIQVMRVYHRQFKSPIKAVNKIINAIRYWKAQSLGYEKLSEEFGTPDLVHIHVLTRTALLAFRLRSKYGIPVLISEHWSGYFKQSKGYRGFLKKRVTEWVVKHASAVTTVSEYLKKAMEAHHLKGTYTIVPNTYDDRLFFPKKKNDVFDAGKKKTIVHISTLSSTPKNLPGILRAIASVWAKRKDFVLEIYGDGKEGHKQRAYAAKLGLLNEAIFFHGNQSRKTIAEAMQAADFLVLFSHYENQPCVIIESFACGIPVVAPNVGGIPEIVNDQRGILVAPKAEAQLEAAIIKMLDESEKYDAKAIHAYASDTFSYEAVGRRFQEIYADLIQQNSP